MANIFCTTQTDSGYSALTLNTSMAPPSPRQKWAFHSAVCSTHQPSLLISCCSLNVLQSKQCNFSFLSDVSSVDFSDLCVVVTKITIPFSLLFFISAKSFWTDPPLWGFPERQPHREWLLWPGVSEHADELGTYTNNCFSCFLFETDAHEYPGTGV